MSAAARHDLTRTVLSILCLFLLIAVALWVLWPFLAAGIWATMLVVSTWPLLRSLEARLGNRRALAVASMTLGMLLLLMLPLWAAIDTIARHADAVAGLAKGLAESGVPPPPSWVEKLPLVGAKLSATWARWADGGAAGLEASLGPYISDAGGGSLPRRAAWAAC